MSSLIRVAVSKKKRRYQKNGFDLDLTYVTPRIIAMGFPSENMEAAFRNPMREVLRFLDSFHKDHYKVYNLCSERGYDREKFYNRVELFPFEDHNAPPFDLILQFCQNVTQWLDLDPKNIAVIHCKAGKGRTGLMIAAWMVYSKEWATAKDALNFYAAMRTYNQKGVTIPSQIRYVHYFEESLITPPQPKTLLLNKIIFHTLPKLAHMSDINFHVSVGKTNVFTYKEHEEKTTKKEEGKKEKEKEKKKKNKKDKEKEKDKEKYKDKESETEEDEERTFTFECGNKPLFADIKVDFTEKGSKLFSFWFCTAFVKENRLILRKIELDKAHKDTSHKSFHPNFRLELVFSDYDINTQLGQISLGPSPDLATAHAATIHSPSSNLQIGSTSNSSIGDSLSASDSASASPPEPGLLSKAAEDPVDQYPNMVGMT